MTQMTMIPPEVPAPSHFDVCGPLPEPGVTVLEASAGTGKTFTIAALVTRFVAEGVPVSEILAVTFTRMATGELRDRVRARLVSAEEGLERYLETGESIHADDSVLRLLMQGEREEVQRRRERLATALTSFDEATITTTHGFCQLMLAGLGVAGDVATGASLLEDPRDLVEEAVDDLYVRRALRYNEAPSFRRSEAVEIGREAVSHPRTELEPEPSESGAGLRRRLADGVRREVERRLLDANLLTFDDLLVRLRESLFDPRRGPAACMRLRSRFSVVLVDEFQDTDPIQWDVVNQAFGDGRTILVLIGDPKQAIYAFRGADVYAYLDAAEKAGQRFTLGVNWRSDADLLAGFDALLDPLRLGHPEIVFRSVEAAPQHHRAGLLGAPVRAPLRARVVYGKGLTQTKSGEVQKNAAVEFVAADVASDIVALLESAAELVKYDDAGHERSRRLLRPGDIAVLVSKNRQARTVQDALRSVGVPAVVAGAESVLSTTAAEDWLSLLEAMEQPASRSRAVSVALTPFIGMSADAVAAAGEAEWEDIHTRLHQWSERLRRRGVASLFRTALAGEGVPARLLRERDGERRLTDLGHIAQLLHKEASDGQQGPPALRSWLARRIDEANTRREGTDAEERSRWLDSDANAVQVLTVHRSKGLEFPVVYCPFLWEAQSTHRGSPVVYHDPESGARRLDVAGNDGGPEYEHHLDLSRQEERGEGLRELYVALTRAKHQVVMWWVRAYHCQHSSLGRLLTVRAADGTVATSGPTRMPKDDEVSALLQEIAAKAAPGLISVERATVAAEDLMWSGRTGGAIGPLCVASFDRSLDLRWRRTSYSGITALLHGGPEVSSEPEEPGTNDEPLAAGAAEALGEEGTVPLTPSADPLRLVSPWRDLPGGVEMGTFVHGVLEETDFTSEDLEVELRRAIATRRSRYAMDPEIVEPLVAALRDALATPLGSQAGAITLGEVGRGDRLDEMGFELPLAGGDRPGDADAVSTGDIAQLFELHEQAGGPLVGYAERLKDPLLATDLRGYLTGSLDLVFRLSRSASGPPRFFVADYKTNWIGGEGEELSAWHYRPAALDVEMQRMHYPLQAVLYEVALHRYLRWRLAGYDPEVHLGGILYLFLRGMCGPDTPEVDGEPCGVFSWRPPVALITDLSDLFEAGS